MTLDDTDAIDPLQTAEDAAPEATDDTQHDPRSHWDKVLAAVQERR